MKAWKYSELCNRPCWRKNNHKSSAWFTVFVLNWSWMLWNDFVRNVLKPRCPFFVSSTSRGTGPCVVLADAPLYLGGLQESCSIKEHPAKTLFTSLNQDNRLLWSPLAHPFQSSVEVLLSLGNALRLLYAECSRLSYKVSQSSRGSIFQQVQGKAEINIF